MTRDFLTALFVIGVSTHLVSREVPTQPPVNGTPTNQASPEPSDPAAVRFSSPTGMVLHAIKPTAVADYEAVIVALQDVLSKTTDADVRRFATSWKVYKAAEPDAKGNVLYVHMLQPAVPEADYRPSLWLDKLLAGAPAELLSKYRDAFALQPSRLSLSDFAHMSVAPAAPANVTPPAPPPNASPSAPASVRNRD